MATTTAKSTATVHPRPLCVDLDGTLINTDLLWECLLLLVKQKPWWLLAVPFWMTKGRVYLKRKLAERVRLQPEALPYHAAVVTYLEQEKRAGRTLILVTGADRIVAESVASFLRLFSEVIASDGVNNLIGEAKLEAIQRRFPDNEFDYLGDSSLDLPIWQVTKRVYCVAHSLPLLAKARAAGEMVQLFREIPRRSQEIRRSLYLHRWPKNLLLFAPLMASGFAEDGARWAATAWACLVYCLFCAGLYVLNDFIDLESDRLDALKRFRPLASGRLSLEAGLGLLVALIGSAFVLALVTLPPSSLWVLAFYGATAVGYSTLFSREPFADVLLVAFVSLLRIGAGALAAEVPVSSWLFTFSMFSFLGAALLHRSCELVRREGPANLSAHKGGYRLEDAPLCLIFGSIASFSSVIILARYNQSEAPRFFFSHPEFLWGLCPLMLYAHLRLWMKAHRREIRGEPFLFVLRDWASYGILGLMALLVVCASI